MALLFPTPATFRLHFHGASTGAELKARAAAVTGVSSARLLIFREAPIADDEKLAACSDLFLAIGETTSPCDSVASQDVPHLASLHGEQAALAERVRCMKTAMELYSKPESRRGLAVAAAMFKAQSAHAAQEAERDEHGLERIELEAALVDMERRAELAESRVLELERQLDEAKRAVAAALVVATPPIEQPAAATAAPTAATSSPVTLVAPAAPSDGTAAQPAAQPAGGDGSGCDGSCESCDSSCDSLLAQIRRDNFADVVVPAELAGAVDHVRGALHRSLVLLSEDLYRDDVHCVSELLQNAGWLHAGPSIPLQNASCAHRSPTPRGQMTTRTRRA